MSRSLVGSRYHSGSWKSKCYIWKTELELPTGLAKLILIHRYNGVDDVFVQATVDGLNDAKFFVISLRETFRDLNCRQMIAQPTAPNSKMSRPIFQSKSSRTL